MLLQVKSDFGADNDRSVDGARSFEEAQRHVHEGQRRVEEQRVRVADLDRDGHDITASQKLLVTFETTLIQMIAHRDLILKELAALD